MNIEQRANDLLAAVCKQRENGMDAAANLYADLQAARRRITALEAEVVELKKPKEEPQSSE